MRNQRKENPMTATQTQHKVVSRDEWLKARLAHLAAEKEFTRKRDELSRQRRELPWERVEKNYVFEGPNGPETLADLFAGRSQLIVYHFMLGPELGRRMQEPARSWPTTSMPPDSPGASRRDVCRGFARARCRASRHFKSAWGGASTGCRHSAPTSNAITACTSRKRNWRARSTTTTRRSVSAWRKRPA